MHIALVDVDGAVLNAGGAASVLALPAKAQRGSPISMPIFDNQIMIASAYKTSCLFATCTIKQQLAIDPDLDFIVAIRLENIVSGTKGECPCPTGREVVVPDTLFAIARSVCAPLVIDLGLVLDPSWACVKIAAIVIFGMPLVF